MRIGLLTVPFNNNYGGFLQAFALKRVIESLGHDVVLVVRKRNRRPLSWKQRLKNCVKELLGRPVDPFGDKYMERMSVNTLPFQKRYLMPQTKPVYQNDKTTAFLKYGIEKFVVGSDQVWRYRYAGTSVTNFFCDFLAGTDIPRFSYSASFGTANDEYPDDVKQECVRLLRTFKAVSVRESSAVGMIHKTLGCPDVDVRQTLDPTLLLQREDYIKLIESAGLPLTSAPHIFKYVLDDGEDIAATERCLQDILKLPVVSMTCFKWGMNEPMPSVESWLQAIATSDFVFTDSFHGMVFAVIFQKPFIVYGNTERGLERFSSFLGLLGLQDRLVTEVTADAASVIDKTIDWDRIYSKLYNLQQESLRFITENLR